MRRRLHAVVSAYAPWEFGGGAERVAWSEARRLAEQHPVVFLHTGGPPPHAKPAGARTTADETRPGAPITTARLGGWLRRLHDPRTRARTAIGKVAFHALLPFNPI